MTRLSFLSPLLGKILLCCWSLPLMAQTVRDFIPTELFTNGIEGPAVDQSGNLYAVNFSEQGTVGIISRAGKAELFIKLPQGSIGNGIRFDADGYMFVADYTGHNILKIDPNNKEAKVYAHSAAMNQPNDIAIAKNGFLYASDPNWQNNSGQIWLIKPDTQPILLEANMGTTNGIEVSPDEKYLYVNESVQRRVWRYNIQANGTVFNKKLFYQFDDYGLDGMRADIEGNLYIARYGAGEIAIVSAAGKLLKTVQLTGRHPTNVAFGGKDGRTLFVTMQTRRTIEYFDVDYAGRSHHLF